MKSVFNRTQENERTTYGAVDRIEVADILRESTQNLSTTETGLIRGKIRKVGWTGSIFMGLVACESLIVLGMTIDELMRCLPITDGSRPDLVYSLGLLLNLGFLIHYATYGTVKERVFELYAYVIASFILTGYVIFKYEEIDQKTGASITNPVVRMVRMILVCVFEPFTIFFAILTLRSFGWVSFLVVGGDVNRQKMWQTYCLYFGLNKLNFQMMLTTILLSCFSQKLALPYEYVIEFMTLGFVFIFFLLAYRIYPYENKTLYIVNSCLSLVQPVYVIWKLVELNIYIDKNYQVFIQVPVEFLGAVSLFCYICVSVTGFITYKNFECGLYSQLRQQGE